MVTESPTTRAAEWSNRSPLADFVRLRGEIEGWIGAHMRAYGRR